MVTDQKSEQLRVTIRNETQKLTANFLNSLGAALIAVGALSPTINALSSTPKDLRVFAVIGWLAVGLVAHLYARSYIEDLEEAE